MSMTAEEVLDRYERLHGLTAAMLQSARGGEWEALLSLERECSGVLQPVIDANGGPPLDAMQSKRKVEVLKAILLEDAEIRSLTSDWMNKLEQFLGKSTRDKAAHQLYRGNA